MSDKKDWKVLQKRVFTRWINSKLISKKIKIKEEEILTTWKAGHELVALLEALSQKTCGHKSKMRAEPKMRINFVENLNWALTFLQECEVKLELKPSAENLLDGEERQIMGMIWGIMRTFLNVGDDPRLNAEKALKLWVRNTTKPYSNVNVQDFTKSWHDGYAFCGLIHAYNPKLIGKWEDLDKMDNLGRIKHAMVAAEKFFGLEQYLAPDEIEILDDKSMIIYVSEYYYGLTKHGKAKTAANRIRGLIEESKINDQLKDDYNKRARALRDALGDAKSQIGDGQGNGTLEGAERKVKEFYELRDKTRGPLLSDFLGLETLYNTITMRLSDQKRPEFKCDTGCSLPELRTSYNTLDRTFKDLEKILLAELRRQREIAKLNNQHAERCQKIKEWAAGKQRILDQEEDIASTGRARFFINQLNTLKKDVETVKSTSVVDVKKLGARLIELKYEHSDAVLQREAEVDALFPVLGAAAAKREALLADALAREEFKENVRIQDLTHVAKARTIQAWASSTVSELKALAQGAPTIEGVDAAEFGLASLSNIREDVVALKREVASWKENGAKIAASEFKGELSSWSFDGADALHQREQQAEAELALIPAADEAAQAALEDAHHREKFKQQVRVLERTHVDSQRKLLEDLNAIKAFLEAKQEIGSIQAANWALRQLNNNSAERKQKREQLNALKTIGAKLTAANYGQWTYQAGAAVAAREREVEELLNSLDALAQSQEELYSGALGNEQQKDQARLGWANEANDFRRWAKDSLEAVNGTLFGATLEEVEAFGLQAQDEALLSELKSRQQSYHDTNDHLKGTAEEAGTYSDVTVEALDTEAQALTAAIGAREGRYHEELAKKRKEEKLCTEFASLANPLMERVAAAKDHISNPTGTLEEQLAYIKKQRAEEEPKTASYFAPIDAKQKEVDGAGITSNPHCLYTAADVRASWDQYLAFMSTKEKMLAEKIEHDRLRGLSEEQWKTIEDTWKRFDKDGSGFLDQKEFKDCLFSLGESKDEKEITALITQFGDGSKVSKAGFENFMINTLGNVKNKEAIEESFQILTNGAPLATLDSLSDIFTDEEVAYIKTKAPRRDDGQIDWRSWVEKEYS